MSSKPGAPGKQQQKRLAAYLNRLARAAKHAARNVPLKDYCRGLVLQLPRKSVEPMAARLAPDNRYRESATLSGWSQPYGYGTVVSVREFNAFLE